MSDITLILLGAGSASRFHMQPKKQWLYSGDVPLWLQVAQNFTVMYDFAKIIVVSSGKEIAIMQYFGDYKFVEGGKTRQCSLAHALEHVTTPYVLVSDIARCCLDESMILRVLEAKGSGDCIVPTMPSIDTLYQNGKPIDRSSVQQIQTPQLSNTALLKKALAQGVEFTDDSSAIAKMGGTIHFVVGSQKAHKLTTVADLEKLPCIKPPLQKTLIGFGIDIHPFEEGKEMKLCATTIDVPYGFKAHSDGDVAIHSLIDALLGAAGFGDIGEFFPDTDMSYKNADSAKLLEFTVKMIHDYGLEITNVDMTIIAQRPKLLPYKKLMRKNLAALLGLRENFVNIKATTAEKLGFLGRSEGVAVETVANLRYFNWTNNENNNN